MPNSNRLIIDGRNNLALQGIHNSNVNIIRGSGPAVIPLELTASLPRVSDLSQIIGREHDMEDIRELLQQKQKVVVVNGLGGIGKTTLAQAYLTRYGSEYAHLLWVTQSEGDNFELDLLTTTGLTLNLGIATQGKDAQTIFTEIIVKLKAIVSEKPCLMVIDNAHAGLGRYFDHLPKPPRWHILVTSRERMERFHAKDLDFLNEADAIALFRQHCRRLTDEADIKAVLKIIDYHTLAIEILAKTAQRHDTPLTTLQAAIERDLASGVYIPHKGDKIERVTSYLLSIFDFATLSAEELRLLRHFAALPTDYVSYEFLKALIPEGEEGGIAPGLQDLFDKGLLLNQAEPEAYRMHLIIREVVKRKLLPTVTELHNMIRNVVDLLYIDQAKDNPTDKFTYIHFGEAILELYPNESDREISRLQNELGRVLQASGDYDTAGALYVKALHSVLTSSSLHNRDTVMVYSNLGTLRRAQGNYDTAKSLLEKAISVSKVVWGENHPKTAIHYSNLALVLQDTKDYSGARFFFEKTVKIVEDSYDGNHPFVAKSYSNLAVLLLILKEYPAAKTLLEKALQSDIINFGENHPNTANCYANLGMAHRELGNNEKAMTFLLKAMQSNETNFGEDHPTTAVSYSNMASILHNLGDYESAFVLALNAHRVYAENHGEQHPNTKKIQAVLNGIVKAMLDSGWTMEQIKEHVRSKGEEE